MTYRIIFRGSIRRDESISMVFLFPFTRSSVRTAFSIPLSEPRSVIAFESSSPSTIAEERDAAEAAPRHSTALIHRPTDREISEVDILHLRGPWEVRGDHGHRIVMSRGQSSQGHSGLIGCRGRPSRRGGDVDCEKRSGRLSSVRSGDYTRPWHVVITSNASEQLNLRVDDNPYRYCRLQGNVTLAAWFINWIKSCMSWIQRRTNVRPACAFYSLDMQR